MNPELRRNLWTEITPTRLVLAPVALGALFALLLATAAADNVADLILAVYAALVGIWGTERAAESISKEVRDHTWDGQRMSVLRPWTLLWGKLLGGTSYVWYGGIICLAIWFAWTPRPLEQWRVPAFALVAGVFAQVLGFLVALTAILKNRARSRALSSSAVVLGCAAVLPFFIAATDERTIRWFGLPVPSTDFALGSLCVFLAWVLATAHQRVRAEMGERTLPFVWIGFGVFLPAYLAGFDLGNGSESTMAVVGPIAAAAFLMYTALLAEPKHASSLRRFVHAVHGKRWRLALEEAPSWLLSLALLAATVLVLTDLGKSNSGVPLVPGATLASIVLLAGRDVAFVLWLNFSRRPERADLFAVVCFTLVYGVVPGTLAALEQHAITAVFWPVPDYPAASLVSSALECAAMGWLVAARWRRTAPGTLAAAVPAR